MIYLKAMVACDTDNCSATVDVLMKVGTQFTFVGESKSMDHRDADSSHDDLRHVVDENTVEHLHLEMSKCPDGWWITDKHAYCPDCTDRKNHGK